jgi:hypothetical protein
MEVTRAEHTQAMDRLHQRIDKINESSIRIEESSKRTEKFVSEMHKLLYGNGRDGLITKVANLIECTRVNRRLIFMVLGIFFGIAAFAMRGVIK